MGAFVLIRGKQDANTGSLLDRVEDQFHRQGFNEPKIFHTAAYQLRLYNKLIAPSENHVDLPNGDFCACTGTLIYNGVTGKAALENLYRYFDPLNIDISNLYGAFCLIVRKNGRTFIFIDRLGIYKVYKDTEGVVWSSSFLSVLATQSRRKIEKQSVYEYVFQGATYGNKTIFSSIELVDCDSIYEVSESVTTTEMPGKLVGSINNESEAIHLERNIANLRRYYEGISKCFGERVDSALSGGYDSRLTLALLWDQGITPKLHVYGETEDSDVRIAQMIANQEGFELMHVDKNSSPKLKSDKFANVVESNYYAFDGYPVDGLFHDNVDILSRQQRCAGNELMLNGGGGEIFRNFFYLRDAKFSIREILWAFYSRFDPKVCTNCFSETEYYSRLTEKIKMVLGIKRDILRRSEIEILYPLFRCRYWMGRNNAINNRLGSALTPFIDYQIVKDAISIPLERKNFGCFEAHMIRALSPSLASHLSSYGHNFLGTPSVKRVLKETLTYWRPSLLRKYSYRIQARLKKTSHPLYLQEQYYVPVIGKRFLYMDNYFKIDEIKDAELFNRICTLEYLFQKCKPELIM